MIEKIVVLIHPVFGLFFYVKNDWCELLFKNDTVRKKHQTEIDLTDIQEY